MVTDLTELLPRFQEVYRTPGPAYYEVPFLVILPTELRRFFVQKAIILGDLCWGSAWKILDTFGRFWTISDNFGCFWTISDNLG